MTMPAERSTAQIIPFPSASLRARREFVRQLDRQTPQIDPALSDLAFGGSWYHAEAVREAAPTEGKHN